MDQKYQSCQVNFSESFCLSPMQVMTQNELYYIFEFLCFKDIANCSQVSKHWKKISEKYFKLLRSFTIQKTFDIDAFLALIPLLQIQELRFQTLINNPTEIMPLLQKVMPTVKLLEINFNIEEPQLISFLLTKIAQTFPSVESFKYFGKMINEENLLIFNKFLSLRELYLLEDCYFEGRCFNSLRPLEVLVIHSHFVRFQNIQGFLRTCKSLKKITLDLEEYEEKEISDLVEILKDYKLVSIDLKYCNNIQNEHLLSLKNQTQIQNLSLRKAYEISGGAYAEFFEKKFQDLEKLKLPMNNGINRHGLLNIANGCKNLRILDLTWCENIEDSRGIYEIFLRCGKLEKISIVGIKKATEAAFPVIKEFYESKNKIKIAMLNEEEKEEVKKELRKIWEREIGKQKDFKFYKCLKFIDATKCDFVPDEVFLLLLLINPRIDARNYYEEKVQFPRYQEVNYDYV